MSKFEFINAAIDFIDVRDEYDVSSDLVCKCKLNGYKVQEGDKIAIFKVGWSHIKDCVIITDVPPEEKCSYSYVIFNKSSLPKDETELYQFCYITNQNELYGASSTFKITAILNNSSKLFNKLFESEFDEKSINKRETRHQKLKDENLTLKQTLKLLLDKQLDESTRQEGNSETVILKASIDKLKNIVSAQNVEIKLLQKKIEAVQQDSKRLSLENASLKTEFEKFKEFFKASQLTDSIKLHETQIEQNVSSFDYKFFDNIPDLPPFPFSKSDL